MNKLRTHLDQLLTNSTKVNSFVRSLIGVAIIPIIPLLFEQYMNERIFSHTLYLASCMYPITIGVWSKSQAVLYLSILFSILGAMVYGVMIFALPPEGFRFWMDVSEDSVPFKASANLNFEHLKERTRTASHYCLGISFIVFNIENMGRIFFRKTD